VRNAAHGVGGVAGFGAASARAPSGQAAARRSRSQRRRRTLEA